MMNIEKAHRVYQINPRVAFECFPEGAMVLRLEDRHLFELNSSAGTILALTDGTRTASEIAFTLADTDKNFAREILSDVTELYESLETQKIVEVIDFLQIERRALSMAQDLSQNIMFKHNPDVLLREEDEDGGLLLIPTPTRLR